MLGTRGLGSNELGKGALLFFWLYFIGLTPRSLNSKLIN